MEYYLVVFCDGSFQTYASLPNPYHFREGDCYRVDGKITIRDLSHFGSVAFDLDRVRLPHIKRNMVPVWSREKPSDGVSETVPVIYERKE